MKIFNHEGKIGLFSQFDGIFVLSVILMLLLLVFRYLIERYLLFFFSSFFLFERFYCFPLRCFSHAIRYSWTSVQFIARILIMFAFTKLIVKLLNLLSVNLRFVQIHYIRERAIIYSNCRSFHVDYFEHRVSVNYKYNFNLAKQQNHLL